MGEIGSGSGTTEGSGVAGSGETTGNDSTEGIGLKEPVGAVDIGPGSCVDPPGFV